MRVITLANLRWAVVCSNHYRLMNGPELPAVDLINNGDGWTIQGCGYLIPVPDEYTGAQMIAKELARQACHEGA
jgi:hypothetical protein